MRIAFLTEGTLAPSSRFRVLQLLPGFRRAGVECVVHRGYGDAYNDLGGTRLGPVYKAAARARRLVGGVLDWRADILFVQRPILPFSSAPERLLAALDANIVFDVDDAVFVGPRGEDVPARRRAFDGIVAVSRHIIAGNRFLANEAGAPDKTTILPTVIDTDRYAPVEKPPADETVIGWMGSTTTLWHLEEILPALRRVRDALPSVRVRIVGSTPPTGIAGEPRFEFVPWSADSEIEHLRSFDIGIMPLADRRVSLGKCGFKMIQYMAVGIPVVASPVGANVDIFEGSGAGFLASTPTEWVEALEALAQDRQLRIDAGGRARAHAVAGYSVDAVLPRYLDLFAEVTS